MALTPAVANNLTIGQGYGFDFFTTNSSHRQRSEPVRRCVGNPVGPDRSETLHDKVTYASSLSMTLDELTNRGVPAKK
jgi:hypothetical protein